MAESPSLEADPSAQVVSDEEAQLVWRSLAGLPDTYREPMVLFYRQGQSVAEVAAGAVASSGAGSAGKGILGKLRLGVFIGPLIGLACAYFGTKAAASTGRSQEEREYIFRYARGIIAFCFVLSIGLAFVLSQAGKLFAPSAGWLLAGISVWTVALVGGIILICQRMDRGVKHIRLATNTTDEAYAKVLTTTGEQLPLPGYFESELRLLGLPLFAIAWGGSRADHSQPRKVCAWIAVGDIAISPFLACGGVAIAPVAVGAISVGVLSLSVFLGVAFGVFALGSLAFGWWAVGCAAAGVKCAVGFAAVARDYAVGLVASGTEAGTAAAKEWITTQWFAEFTHVIDHQWIWWLLGCVAAALVLRVWRDRKAASGI